MKDVDLKAALRRQIAIEEMNKEKQKKLRRINIPGIVIYAIMEITLIILIFTTGCIRSMLDESLGTFILLNVLIIAHTAVGSLIGLIFKTEIPSWGSMSLSVIICLYEAIYAIRDLVNSAKGLEGVFTVIVGVIIFPAVALGVGYLCLIISNFICKLIGEEK